MKNSIKTQKFTRQEGEEVSVYALHNRRSFRKLIKALMKFHCLHKLFVEPKKKISIYAIFVLHYSISKMYPPLKQIYLSQIFACYACESIKDAKTVIYLKLYSLLTGGFI